MADNKIKPYMQPAFLTCVSVLLAAFVVKSTLLGGFETAKIPIDLRKSLDDIDREKLLPYKVVSERKIENTDVLESLGTEDYIEWIIEDTSVNPQSPVRLCSLFITYYGVPDNVPHVPDECYIGSGYDQIDNWNDSLDVEGFEDRIPVRTLKFHRRNKDILVSDPDFCRMYFFKVNYDYQCTRTGVRISLGKNLTGKHSFFSKVEWEFFGPGFRGKTRPSKKQNEAASKKLISRLLPILENDHWPDLKELESKEQTETEIEAGANEKQITP